MAKNRVPTGSTRSLSFGSKIQTSQIEISKSPPSKNLAHVPCKFFRQGICQAGSSCPFAHTLDTLVETAPCKYFQKGNCKFGVKCALAHILPDGRRVNPKSLAQVYQHGSNNNNNNNNNNNTNNNNNNHHLNHHGGSNNNSHRKSFTMDSPQNSNNNNNNNNNNGYLSQSNSYQSASPQNIISSHTLSPQQTVNGFAKYDYLNQSTSPTYQFNSSNNNITSSSRSSFSGSNTSFLYGTTTTTATTNPRTVSMSDQRPTSTYNTPSIWSNTATTSSAVTDSAGSSKPSFFSSSRSVSHSASFRPIFANSSSLTSRDHDHESAILDDEDAHEGMFEEDFVPSSLSDLLTPQELERRGSRPSGTRPLVLPHLKGDEEQQQLPPPPVSDVDEEADDNEMQFRMDEDFQTSSVGFENRGGGGNAYVWHK